MMEEHAEEPLSQTDLEKAACRTEFLEQILNANLDDFYRVVLDGIQAPVFIVEQDVRIVDYNAAAGAILAAERKLVTNQRAGEALHCLHSTDAAEGCGRGPSCSHCTIRNSVNQSLHSESASRHKVTFEMCSEGEKTKIDFLVTASPLFYADHKYVLLVMENIAEVKAALQ